MKPTCVLGIFNIIPICIFGSIGCGKDSPISGTWTGTYTDTELLKLWLVYKALYGEDVTDEELKAILKLTPNRDIKLQLEQKSVVKSKWVVDFLF